MAKIRMAILMSIICCIAATGLGRTAGSLPVVRAVDLRSLAGEGWFRASLFGRPVGYLHSSATVTEQNGKQRLRTAETLSLQVDFGRGPVEVKATTSTEYGPNLKPIRLKSVQDEFGRVKTIEAVIRDGKLHVRTKAGEIEREKTLTLGPDFGSELVFTVAAMQGALPDHGQFRFQSFVPELEMLVDFDVNCLGRETVEVNGEKIEALKVQFSAERIGLEMDSWLGPDGDLLRQAIPSLMDLVLEKVSEEEALSIATPLTISDHIPVSRHIGSAKQLTYVRLKAASTGLPPTELLPETSLQHVAALPDGSAEVTLKAETDEGLEGHRLPFSDPQLHEYLTPTDIIQSDDPAIVAKAREIIGDEPDAWRVAKKLIRWVYDNMTKVDHDPRPITATECLQTMTGDCSEHATLLCALARAVGIPSKFVTGLVYLNGGYYYHAWNELYLGRWVAVDPTWGEYTLDAGHITLASSSLTSESFAKTNLSAVRSMGVLSLEILDYRTR